MSFIEFIKINWIFCIGFFVCYNIGWWWSKKYFGKRHAEEILKLKRKHAQQLEDVSQEYAKSLLSIQQHVLIDGKKKIEKMKKKDVRKKE